MLLGVTSDWIPSIRPWLPKASLSRECHVSACGGGDTQPRPGWDFLWLPAVPCLSVLLWLLLFYLHSQGGCWQTRYFMSL